MRGFEPTPSTVRPFLLVVWATASLLILGLLVRLSHVHYRADTAAGVLVAAPAVYAALLVRSGEHPVTKALIRPLKIAALVSGVLAFLAAATLALKFPPIAPQNVPLVGAPLAWLARMDVGTRAALWAAIAGAALLTAVTGSLAYWIGRRRARLY
jgi:hypothetical protein